MPPRRQAGEFFTGERSSRVRARAARTASPRRGRPPSRWQPPRAATAAPAAAQGGALSALRARGGHQRAQACAGEARIAVRGVVDECDPGPRERGDKTRFGIPMSGRTSVMRRVPAAGSGDIRDIAARPEGPLPRLMRISTVSA